MQQDNNRLISIIIPSFNRENLIGDTLNSVLTQTYSNWECIIIDDGSTDSTQRIITGYLSKDQRFRFFQRNREPKGAPVCRNIGIEKSKGKFIIFLDSDDLLANNCLENRMNFAKKNPDNDFWVFGTAQFNKITGDSLAKWNVLNKEIDDLQRFILQDAPWHTMGPLWLKSTLLDIGGFDESAICWQDWEMHIRVLLRNYKYWKSNEKNTDTFYRNDKSNKTNTISANQNQLQHILFRLDLFRNFYIKVTKVDQRKEIREAFSVLFFRLLKELNIINEKTHIQILIRFLKKENLFNKIELLLINIYIFKFHFAKVEKMKVAIIHKSLFLINQNVFFNKTNSTFQS